VGVFLVEEVAEAVAEAGNNKKVIMWIILFPPLGLVRIWTKSTWNNKIKLLVTFLVVSYLAGVVILTAYPIWNVNKILDNYYM